MRSAPQRLIPYEYLSHHSRDHIRAWLLPVAGRRGPSTRKAERETDVRDDHLARGEPRRSSLYHMQSEFPRSQSRLLPFDMDPSPLPASDTWRTCIARPSRPGNLRLSSHSRPRVPYAFPTPRHANLRPSPPMHREPQTLFHLLPVTTDSPARSIPDDIARRLRTSSPPLPLVRCATSPCPTALAAT